MLQADPLPDWPVHRTPEPRSHPSDLFEVLKGNNIMKAINADLVPIMIATEGPDFSDKNNVEKASYYIVIIIAVKELGGFTTETLPRALRGRKVEMKAFATKSYKTSAHTIYSTVFLNICLSDHYLVAAARAYPVHCKDMRDQMIALLCKPREIENRRQIVALKS
jgi:hypothetical protein